jgi:hypothetical protein
MPLGDPSGSKGSSVGASKMLHQIKQSILCARPTVVGIRLNEDARFQRNSVHPRGTRGVKSSLPDHAFVLMFVKP